MALAVWCREKSTLGGLVKKTLALAGSIVGTYCWIATSVIFKGYTLSLLWEWFVTPAFWIPAIDLAPAIGLVLIAEYLPRQTTVGTDIGAREESRSFFEDNINLMDTALGRAQRSLLALLFGWIVHLFM